MRAVLDTSVLFACSDLGDSDFNSCSKAVLDCYPNIVVPSTVIVETAFMIGSRISREAESLFAEVVADGEMQVENIGSQDWRRISTILKQYSDLNIGSVDASIVAVAERLGIDTVLTLDHRHFSVIRPEHIEFLKILPAPLSNAR